MMAELYDWVDGYNRGKGGSMHFADVSLSIYGANGIVGAGCRLPPALHGPASEGGPGLSPFHSLEMAQAIKALFTRR